VQLAAQAGATVVASVRDRARREGVVALGAHEVIEPGAEAEHGPYDVVLELVGAPSLTAALPALATGARVVVIGVGGGATVDHNLFSLMGRRARIGGSTLRARSRTDKATVAAAVTKHVLPLLADGRLKVPVCDTFPMAEAEAAYARFAEGAKLGKVVLVND
jgi:NADPH:quinone reductase-like Zn-dependent oxidoreductase